MGNTIQLAVVAADSHLGCRRTLDDGYFAFQQLVDAAIKIQRPLIILGDLVDARSQGPETAAFLSDQLRRMSDEDLMTFTIEGNHDGIMSSRKWSELGRKTRSFGGKKITLGDVEIYGIDYQNSRDQFKEALSNAPKADVLATHTAWQETLPAHYVMTSMADLADVTESYKLVMSGHIHEFCYAEKYYRNASGALIDYYSPGATHQTRVSEPSKAGYGILNNDLSITLKSLRTRYYREFILNNEDDMTKFLDGLQGVLDEAAQHAMDHKLPKTIKQPRFRIAYSADIEDAERRINRYLDTYALLSYKQLAPHRPEVTTTVQLPDVVGEAITLKMMLPEVVNQKKDSKRFDLATMLLDASDPEVALEQWKQNILQEGN